MSARQFARNLANGMGDGRIDSLPRLTRHATPAYARQCLAAYYCLRDSALALRAEISGTATLRERVAMASVLQQIDAAIDDARAWLSRAARRGIRPGETGCRGGAPAVKGHGCPALSPAVGPAPADLEPALHNFPENPLSCVRKMQDLPVPGFHEHNRPAAVGRGK